MPDIFSEAKVDTHCHILDPARFAYAADVAYRPQGQEIGDQESLAAVMASHGVRHALLVGNLARERDRYKNQAQRSESILNQKSHEQYLKLELMLPPSDQKHHCLLDD